MLEVYRQFVEEYLAIPVIPGKNTESEKFAGAEYTTCIEALMQDGKALQAGTSHMLGQNFAKVFGVKYLDKSGREQFVWQTSWGLSTRIVGALIMVHSDDKWLVLPPKIASTPVVIVPIWSSEDERDLAVGKANNLAQSLRKELDVNVKVDEREGRPGFKFFEWEKKGIPIRVELGPKDIANESLVLVRRDTGEKTTVKEGVAISFINNLLETIQADLFKKALAFQEENTHWVDDRKAFQDVLKNKGGFILAHWCGDSSCEEQIAEETKATIRCIPFDQKKEKGKCIKCEKDSESRVIFAKAY